MSITANPVMTANKAGAMNEASLSDTSRGPARPERLAVDFYEQPDALVVHKRRGVGPWVSPLLWLIGWTAICVMLLAHVLNEPSLWAFG